MDTEIYTEDTDYRRIDTEIYTEDYILQVDRYKDIHIQMDRYRDIHIQRDTDTGG